MTFSKSQNPERVMHEIGEDACRAGTGHTAARECEGLTPQGNSIGGRWVLRAPNGDYIDVDQYRHDLFSRHGFFTSY